MQLEVYDVMAHDEQYTPLIQLNVPCCREGRLSIYLFIYLFIYSFIYYYLLLLSVVGGSVVGTKLTENNKRPLKKMPQTILHVP